MFPADSITEAPPMQFCRAYAAAAKGLPISSVTASQLAAWYVIHDLVVRANSSDRSALLAVLASADVQCFFSLVHFDRFGRNSARQMPQRQLIDTEGNTSLVFPFVTSAVLPMPTFSERIFHQRFFATRVEQGYAACAALGSCASVALLVFLVAQRQHRVVQTLTLALSVPLIVGCLVLYWSPLTWSVYDTHLSCALRVPLWTLGYLLLLAPIANLEAAPVVASCADRKAGPPCHSQQACACYAERP